MLTVYDSEQDDSLECTAVRETFEETGLLVGVVPSQSSSASANRLSEKELDAARKDIHAKRKSFAEFLQGAGELERTKAAHNEELSRKDSEAERSHKSLADRLAKATEDLETRLNGEIEKHASALARSREEHTNAMHKSREEMEALNEQHTRALGKLRQEHLAAVESLQADHQTKSTQAHESALSAVKASHEEELLILRGAHAEELAKAKREHQTAISTHEQAITAAEDHHRTLLESVRSDTERNVLEAREAHREEITKLARDHSHDRDILLKDNQLLRDQLKAMESEVSESRASHERIRTGHEKTLSERDVKILGLQGNLTASHTERESLMAEIAKLRKELQVSASKQKALVEEALQRKALVNDLQSDAKQKQDLIDAAQAEKQRQDALVKELQEKVVSSPHPVNGIPLPPVPETRTLGERQHSFTRASGMLSSSKLPPITPPPSIPPPPPPTSKHIPSLPSDAGHSVATISSLVRSSSSSRESQPESPSTSVGPSLAHGTTNSNGDLKHALEAQQKQKVASEQETAIKNLEKQLHHAEGELQAHVALVATLENQLGESERNLRKARMQATELAKERDKATTKLEALRTELQDAKRELTTIRRSVLEEKQSLEHRLDEERKAKERARAALDARVDEVQRRKSKFACL